MKWIKKKVVLGIVLASSMIISGCGSISAPNSNNVDDNEKSNSSDVVELTFWDNYTEPGLGVILDTIIENYESENPDVKIKRSAFKLDDLRNTIKPALTSNKGPDLFVYDSGPGYLGLLSDAGLAMDLTESAKERGWNERFPEWINERVTFDGKLYGIGNEVELIGVYYNKEIFKELGVEVPKTYEEFLEICQLAKEKGYTPIAFDDKDQWPAFHIESAFYTSVVGKEGIQEVLDGEATFDQPKFAEALDTFYELVEKDYVSKSPLSISYDDGNKEFFSGKAAMRITGTWLVSPAEEQLGDNAGFFLLPSKDPNLPLSAPGGIGSAVVASSKTSHPEEVVDFLDYLFSDETAGIWYENGLIPPLDIDSSTLDLSPLAKEVVELANSDNGLSYNIDVLMPTEVNEVTKNLMQQLIAGKITGKDVVEKKQEAFEQTMKD